MAKGKGKKKNNKGSKKVENVQTNEMNIRHKIYAVIGILCFFLFFYLLTVYITNKNNPKEEEDNTTNEVSISYDEIILGGSLSMGNEEYLVIFYDSSDEEINSEYSSKVSDYRNREEHLSLYYVDMSKAFNKPFATTEESNKSPDSTQNMKINGPTLIRVVEGRVTEYLEGLDSINSVIA